MSPGESPHWLPQRPLVPPAAPTVAAHPPGQTQQDGEGRGCWWRRHSDSPQPPNPCDRGETSQQTPHPRHGHPPCPSVPTGLLLPPPRQHRPRRAKRALFRWGQILPLLGGGDRQQTAPGPAGLKQGAVKPKKSEKINNNLQLAIKMSRPRYLLPSHCKYLLPNSRPLPPGSPYVSGTVRAPARPCPAGGPCPVAPLEPARPVLAH